MSGTTDIYDLARKNMKKYDKSLPEPSQAEQIYSKSLKSIQQIEWTEGYEAIKNYWKKEFSVALSDLGKTNAIDEPGLTTKLQERVDLSNRFLYYLSVFEKNW